MIRRSPAQALQVTKETGAADDALSSALRAALEQELVRNRAPGAQAVVRREGEVLWSACAGRLSLASRGAATDEAQHVRPEDRFVIASITKLVVACVVLSLVERGELVIDETIEQWLPGLPNADRITLRMLLSHGSGLSEYFKDEWVRRQIKDNPLRTWCRREIMDAVARLGPEAEPGERFAYRNTNYLVIGEILELSTGKRIGELIEDHVCRPLGLGTLSFTKESPGGGRLAAPYIWQPIRYFNPLDSLKPTGGHIPSDAIGEVWTDGGIASSAEDLAALTEALFNGRLLRAQTVEEMSTPPGYGETFLARVLRLALAGSVESAYGLGVAIEQQRYSRDSLLVGHDGTYLGWSSTTTYETRSRVTVTVLTNLAGINMPARRLERKLRAALA